MRMAKDGLFFSPFAKLHPKYQTPVFGTIFTGILSGLLALVLDINVLTDMISIGTLLGNNIAYQFPPRLIHQIATMEQRRLIT